MNLYEGSGSDNKNIEEIAKGENKRNAKESRYTNTDKDKKGKRADLLEDEKPGNHHKIPRKKGGLRSSGPQGNGPVKPGHKHFHR